MPLQVRVIQKLLVQSKLHNDTRILVLVGLCLDKYPPSHSFRRNLNRDSETQAQAASVTLRKPRKLIENYLHVD
jgi:hypothetical protein